MTAWNPFPYDASAYQFEGGALYENWDSLHAGDRVEYPDDDWVQAQLESYPQAAPDAFDGNVGALAEQIQQAWRAFHRGDFEAAITLAGECGQLAHAAANKAAGIYANYLESDEKKQASIFSEAAARAEEAIVALPDDPNSHYFHAFNLGRYSQSVSVVDALRQGIGGKIQDSLSRTLELEPDHAEAHTAFGMYHAEIIDKVGRMIGGMTYGASSDKALEHFQRAVKLTPDSPIAHIEFGNGLYLMFGDKQLEKVTELYISASEMEPQDAMEKLDVESAVAELE